MPTTVDFKPHALRARREELGLTREHVALATSRSVATISAWEEARGSHRNGCDLFSLRCLLAGKRPPTRSMPLADRVRRFVRRTTRRVEMCVVRHGPGQLERHGDRECELGEPHHAPPTGHPARHVHFTKHGHAHSHRDEPNRKARHPRRTRRLQRRVVAASCGSVKTRNEGPTEADPSLSRSFSCRCSARFRRARTRPAKPGSRCQVPAGRRVPGRS